jgi:predicted amidophosphoribosyltransferase
MPTAYCIGCVRPFIPTTSRPSACPTCAKHIEQKHQQWLRRIDQELRERQTGERPAGAPFVDPERT